MQTTKVYIGLNTRGQLISADAARLLPDGEYRCQYCHCPLLIHGTALYLKAWFSHDPVQLTPDHIEQCPDADIVANLQSRAPTPVMWWRCVRCHRSYYGNKRCSGCFTGIHSIPV